MSRPSDLITALGMQPHPEGGHYVEAYRSPRLTIIFFLERIARMRNIEIRSVDEVHVVFVDGENTGFDFTKQDVNAMVDDLVDTYAASGRPRLRNDLLAELVTKSLAGSYARHPLEDGALTAEEVDEVIRLVTKACKKGWFS